MNDHLYRSDDNVFAGVCGGIAEYLELDPTLVRILFVIACLAGMGFPVLAYVVMMIFMPKRPAGQQAYIDVEPSGSPSGVGAGAGVGAGVRAAANAGNAADATANVGAKMASSQSTSSFVDAATMPTPGCDASVAAAGISAGACYTTANPQAFDVNASEGAARPRSVFSSKLQSALFIGIIFVSVGIFGLLKTFFGIDILRFWPMVLMAIGVLVLFTPGGKGWSLERAGNAIFLMTVALILQLWVFGYLGLDTMVQSVLLLWPVVLIMVGLAIIGSVTKNGIFSLLSSLLVSATLIFGIWYFGNIPGYFIDVSPPFVESSEMRLYVPSSPNLQD